MPRYKTETAMGLALMVMSFPLLSAEAKAQFRGEFGGEFFDEPNVTDLVRQTPTISPVQTPQPVRVSPANTVIVAPLPPPPPPVVVIAPIVVSSGATRLDITTRGTPIVNIAAPNADGTSHNIFSRFNVGREGTIINNGTGISQTTTAGQVLANPNLRAANTPARLIINEVRAGTRSDLLGVVEIAGSRAGLILANPAGITCNGCGFINASRVTLTTGVPQFSAARAFTGLAVNGGDIRIEGAGLFGANPDYFDIVSGIAQINGQIQAQSLLVSGGNQTFNYTAGTATALGASQNRVVIDSTLLGGAYANRIRLIGTGAGVGINLLGVVEAQNGSVAISAPGAVTIRDVAAGGDVIVNSSASSVTVREALFSGSNIAISAASDVQVGRTAVASAYYDPTQVAALTNLSRGLNYGIPAFANLDGYYDGIEATRVDPSIEAFGNITVSAGRDILNLDRGWISGDAVALFANQDIKLGGGTELYGNNVALDAGRDVSLASVSRLRSTSDYTDLGRGLYRNTFLTRTEVIGAQIDSYGSLIVNAGRDVLLETASLTADGVVSLAADRDVAITGVASTGTTTASWKTGKNTTGNSTEIVSNYDGSRISSGLGVLLNASEELEVTGSVIESEGGISLWADRGTAYIAGSDINAAAAVSLSGRDVLVTGSLRTSSFDETTRKVKRGFLSKKTTTTATSNQIETVFASTVSGRNVDIFADQEVSILDSNVAGDLSVDIEAGSDVTISSIPTSSNFLSSSRVKKSGFSLGSGGLFLGVSRTSNVVDTNEVTHLGSLIGAAGGAVRISAGASGGRGHLDIVGSQIAALDAVVLAGDSVEIVNNVNVVTTATSYSQSSIGLTTAISSPLLSAVTGAYRVGQIASQTSNARVQLVSGLAAGFAIRNGYDAAKNLAQTIRSGTGDLGVTLSSTLGYSRTTSTSLSIDQTIVASQIAGGDVSIIARDVGGGGISIYGSDVAATRDLRLLSNDDIDLSAAIATNTVTGRSRTVGFSVGVSFGLTLDKKTLGGPTVSANFNSSTSSYSGIDVTARPTIVGARGTATLESAGLLNIDGAILSGNRVVIDAGALNVFSRQNTSNYLSRERSIGLGISYSGGSISGNVNIGSGNQVGSFATVADQAGIRAGAGGFDIDVAGLTELRGGVIASTAGAALNRLRTGRLAFSNVNNFESYNATSTSFGGGFGSVALTSTGQASNTSAGTPLPAYSIPGFGSFSTTLPTALSASGAQASVTLSALSAANVTITSMDAASLAALETISRNTSATGTALTRQFTDARRTEIAQGFEAVRQLTTEVTTFFANRAAEETDAEAAARAAGVVEENGVPKRDAQGNLIALNPAAQAHIDRAAGIRRDFGSGSVARIGLTALTGAAGGNVTGSVRGLAQSVAVNVVQSLAVTQIRDIADSFRVFRNGAWVNTPTSETVRTLLQGIVGCVGAAAQNASCSSGALGASSSVLFNLIVDAIDRETRSNANDPASRTLASQQARTALIATLTGALASALGGDVGTAVTAARIETENNALCSSGTRGCPSSLARTTTAEQAALDSGRIDEYWRLRIAAGDPVATQALAFGSSDRDALTGVAYNILFDFVADKYGDFEIVSGNGLTFTRLRRKPLTTQQLAAVNREIAAYRIELGRQHAAAVNQDRSGIPGLLSPLQITQYHWRALDAFGLPHRAFAGTPITGTRADLYVTAANRGFNVVWCDKCDSQ